MRAQERRGLGGFGPSRQCIWPACRAASPRLRPPGTYPGATEEVLASLPFSLLRPSPPPFRVPGSRDQLAGAGPRGAPCALTATSSSPGARGSLLGESLETAARRRACDSGAAAGSGGEIRRPRPRRGPSPRPPPPPRASAAQCSARRRVRHKQTRLGRTWAAELLRLATDRGLRAPRLQAQGTAREGRRARPGPAPAASAQLPSATLPLHGSAAAAAHAALQAGGASRQRGRTLGQGLNSTAASSPAPLHPLRKAEARETGGRKQEPAEGSGKSGLCSPRDSPAGRRLRPGRRGRVAPSLGPAAAERRLGAPGRPRAPAGGRRPRLTWPPAPPSPSPPLQPERGSAGLEHGRV